MVYYYCSIKSTSITKMFNPYDSYRVVPRPIRFINFPKVSQQLYILGNLESTFGFGLWSYFLNHITNITNKYCLKSKTELTTLHNLHLFSHNIYLGANTNQYDLM